VFKYCQQAQIILEDSFSYSYSQFCTHHDTVKDDKTSRRECRPEVLLELGPMFGVQSHEIVSSYQHFCDAMVAFYDHPDEVDRFIETLNERYGASILVSVKVMGA